MVVFYGDHYKKIQYVNQNELKELCLMHKSGVSCDDVHARAPFVTVSYMAHDNMFCLDH